MISVAHSLLRNLQRWEERAKSGRQNPSLSPSSAVQVFVAWDKALRIALLLWMQTTQVFVLPWEAPMECILPSSHVSLPRGQRWQATWSSLLWGQPRPYLWKTDHFSFSVGLSWSPVQTLVFTHSVCRALLGHLVYYFLNLPSPGPTFLPDSSRSCSWQLSFNLLLLH